MDNKDRGVRVQGDLKGIFIKARSAFSMGAVGDEDVFVALEGITAIWAAGKNRVRLENRFGSDSHNTALLEIPVSLKQAKDKLGKIPGVQILDLENM